CEAGRQARRQTGAEEKVVGKSEAFFNAHTTVTNFSSSVPHPATCRKYRKNRDTFESASLKSSIALFFSALGAIKFFTHHASIATGSVPATTRPARNALAA